MSEKIAERGLPGKFDYLEHPADLYILAYGKNLLELFENAGIALFESMTNTSNVEGRVSREIRCEGYDLENLLYRWLEELLLLYYDENLMCGNISVERIIFEKSNGDVKYVINGKCWGEEFDPKRHESRVEVKAVTYHLMRIIRDENGWRAYFVLDI
jgi:SHS2 domain-containing protein